MNEKTLDALLRIAIEGPSISEFPVSDAVKLWAAKKKKTNIMLTFFIFGIIIMTLNFLIYFPSCYEIKIP